MNAGKLFEQQIKASVPEWCFYHRIQDSTGTFSGGSGLRFSSEQPFDALLFDSKRRTLYAIELKSTKNKSFSFEDPFADGKQQTRMIHKHQILSLIDADAHENMVGGFLFNFRDETTNDEETYFQSIKDFVHTIQSCGKKSINRNDLVAHNAIPLAGSKKRTRWLWDIALFLQQYDDMKGR